MKYLYIILLFPLLLMAQKKEIIAYFPSWAVSNPKPYYIKNIISSNSADKLTLINYAFAIPAPDSEGNIVPHLMHSYFDYQQAYTSAMSVDGIADDSLQPLKGHFNQLRKLKKMYPKLKIVISLGGWTGSTYFSDAVLTEESRKRFVQSCIDVFIKGNLPLQNGAGGMGAAAGIFDGIDIDWEFPFQGGDTGIHHNENDEENLTKLFALFRKELDKIKPGLILSAAIPSNESLADNYNINKNQKYLNYYQLMTYDFHGSWDTITNHHTNLLTSLKDPDTLQMSFDKTVKLFLNKYKVKRNKIVAGAAFYGRGWKEVDSVNYGLYRKGTVADIDGGFNDYSSLITYSGKGYNYYWDEIASAPYLYNRVEKVFFSFDDAQSILLKSKYVDAYNLRGVMFWEISGDDSAGTLVNTIFTRRMPELFKSEIITPVQEYSLTLSLASDKILRGDNLTINTTSSGDIAKVKFYGDKKLLGCDTSYPFNWVWFNMPAGKHKLSVAAYNSKGESVLNDKVRIIVK